MSKDKSKGWQCGSGHYNETSDKFCRQCFEPHPDMKPVYPAAV